MNTVYLFYKSFSILKIKVALISCRWSKARSKADENNGLIRHPAESVPGLCNREIAPISSPCGVGVENQTPLACPLGGELVEVIGLTPCSAYADFDHCPWRLLELSFKVDFSESIFESWFWRWSDSINNLSTSQLNFDATCALIVEATIAANITWWRHDI